ncbi:MAG TPA: LysM peptidoglycan-binding domain-containing protein [Anaerolineae bacterium]
MKCYPTETEPRFQALLLLCMVVMALVVGCRRDAGDAATAVPGNEPVDSEDQPPTDQPITESEEPQSGPTPAQLPLAQPIILDPPPTSPFTPGATVLHPVSRGEWLIQLARCYGASYRVVRHTNRLPNPNRIYPGMTITVPNIGSNGAVIGPPCVQLYAVQTGDTWESLAQRYQTTVAILRRANPGSLTPGRLIYVPSTTPAAGPPPVLSHSLLFHFNGDLALWRSSDSRVEFIPDDEAQILDLATNADGRMVLAKRTRDAGGTVEIALVDRTARTITLVESGLPPGPNDPTRDSLLLAPNGQWAVYLAPVGDSYRVTTLPTSAPASLKTLSGISHGVNQDVPPQLFPGHDDGHFLWLDGGGVFEFDYSLDTGERKLYEITSTDPSSPLGFTAMAWSPAGRYLLLHGFFIEGGAYFILDRETGTLLPLPDSSGYVTIATASWRPDGTVAVLTPPDADAPGPQRTIYRPETGDGGFTLVEISKETLTAPGRSASASALPGYVITAPAVQPAAGQLLLAIQGSDSADGLWTVADDSTSLVWRNNMPASFYRAIWVPDGSGVLAEVAAQPNVAVDVRYVATNGSRPYSLMSWLGFAIGDFQWIKP